MSKTMMVRYKVKPDQAEHNAALSRRVYDELQRSGLAGFHYATFVLEDGLSFVHISSNENEDGPSPLLEIPVFQDFLRDIASRCDEPPATSVLREVGSYRLWNQ